MDRFVSWRRDFAKRVEAGQDLTVELLIGAELVAGGEPSRAMVRMRSSCASGVSSCDRMTLPRREREPSSS